MRPGQFLAIAAVLGACTPSDTCEDSLDCAGGEVCASTHECLASESVQRVEVRWTLSGQPPSTETCAAIERMELTVYDRDTDASATYSPVPCATGVFVFLALPLRFDSVAMSAFVDGAFAEAQQGAIGESGLVQLDFTLR